MFLLPTCRMYSRYYSYGYDYWQNTAIFPTALCVDGEVRLVDGDRETEGRVEICFSGRWGTINGDGWTMTESTVVCNDLGHEATGI